MEQFETADVRGAAETAGSKDWLRRTLLVITPADSVSENLVHALEREFPSIGVELVPTLEAGCTRFEYPVSLVLVDAMLLSEIDDCSARLARCHPTAPIALMRSDDRVQIAVHDVFAARVVRGVLPMNLKLDVWLSVVRLFLRGGEYFPHSMFQTYADGAQRADTLAAALPAGADDDGLDGLDVLTERETQILEMVSRGLQNKNIASALRLSEYTVKIHLHHIITKLGAHNRTQAAAIFHDCKAAQHRTTDDPPPM